MGGVLPTAVTSVVVKRHAGAHFRVGLAEMNGWRFAMEDAHVIFTPAQERWGFFGVFDGHGGSQCSNFVARRFVQELEAQGMPRDDDAVSSLVLRLDREFLHTKEPSGSTGTFAIVTAPRADEVKYHVRIANIGDSRVLVGRTDGSMVEGPGTDGGMTTDHKPDLPSEKERIERTGGRVQMVQGVARVNGDLAVSRSFGDEQHKKTGDPETSDHPVSAAPEFTSLDCDPTDFLVLVCDGISEGEFPNREVIQLAAKLLREGGAKPNIGKVATAVCNQALAQGSRDNLSCMIVLLGGGEVQGPGLELLPGPYDSPSHAGFKRTYKAMAEHAGLTLPRALEMRYDMVRKELEELRSRGVQPPSSPAEGQRRRDEPPDEESSHFKAVVEELAVFGEGPPQGLAAGTAERTKWFDTWVGDHACTDLDFASMPQEQVQELLEQRPDLLAGVRVEEDSTPQVVKVMDSQEELRKLVEPHPALKWSDDYSKLAGLDGVVLDVDESDGTAKVHFSDGDGKSVEAWLPVQALTELEVATMPSHYVSAQRAVHLADAEQLQAAFQESPTLRWHERMKQVANQDGVVLWDDPQDGTSQVKFPPPADFTVWLPTRCLTEVEDAEAKDRILAATLPAQPLPGEGHESGAPPAVAPESPAASGGTPAADPAENGHPAPGAGTKRSEPEDDTPAKSGGDGSDGPDAKRLRGEKLDT